MIVLLCNSSKQFIQKLDKQFQLYFHHPMTLINTSKIGGQQTLMQKRSYSYQDIIKLESKNLYTSMGSMIDSKKPTSQRATFGKSQRKQTQKVLEPFKMAQIDNVGKQSKGPAAYLPPRYTLENGQTIETKDPTEKFMYNQTPNCKIGKSQRKSMGGQRYNYMNSNNDDIDVNTADFTRRESSPSVKIGTQMRFPQERADKITPGPTYDPAIQPQKPLAPKYTLGAKRPVKGQDPLIPTNSTTNLVGPSTYFQKNRSQSTGDLLRVPVDSKIKKVPAMSFTKGPKSLNSYRTSVDETYDLKTNTMMANYDFEYDAGKGLHSGLSYMKKNIMNSCKQPLEKNKMKSYTINKASREKEQKRGTFASMMSNVPATVRINVPKF